jgi:hypothetical protein
MKTMIELPWEAVDKIVVDSVRDSLTYLNGELERIRNKQEPTGIFSHDVEEDVFQIVKHIEAFELVIEYFGGSINK